MKKYSIAIRKRNNGDRFWELDDYIFDEVDVDTEDRYWLADPFIVERNGVTYIFCEAYDMVERRGKIGYFVYGQTAKPKLKIVINETYHLSFPFLYEKENDMYIVPETCENNSIQVYRVRKFPNEWKVETILIDNIYACDSLLISNQGHQYLLTNEMYDGDYQGHHNYCWVKDVIFDMSCWKCNFESKRLVDEGDFGNRNAGSVFEYRGKLVRPGQDCTDNNYGKGLVFNEILMSTPYEEKTLFHVDCKEFSAHLDSEHKCLLGVHTYNSTEQYEVVDICYEEKISFFRKMRISFYRRLYEINQKIRCLCKIVRK